MRQHRLWLSLLSVVGAVWICMIVSAQAQDRTARIMVAFPAGGGQDLVARVLAPHLQAAMGQTVIVENSSGGAGLVGIMEVAKSRPDGNYLLMNTLGLAINHVAYKKLPYDVLTDLEPVAMLGTTPYYLGINPNLGFTSMTEFLASARANPGKYRGASFANSAGHLTIEMLRQRGGIDVQTIPYRGVAPAAAAVIGGESDFLMVDGASILPFIDSGKLRGLGVASPRRDPDRPAMPTMTEGGLQDFVILSWYGLLARAGTPAAILDRWNVEINKVLALPDVQSRLKSVGLRPTSVSRAEFGKRLRDDITLWQDVVTKGKFQLLD
jgi:tripartite-type tricarboxylate transporter receptor subunit TctC